MIASQTQTFGADRPWEMIDDVHGGVASAVPDSRLSGRFQTLFTAMPLIGADLLAVVIAFVLVWQGMTAMWPSAAVDWGALGAAFLGAVLVANMALELYPGIGLSAITEVRQATAAAACIAPVFLCVTMLRGAVAQSTGVAIVATSGVLLVTLPVARAGARSLFSRFAWWGQGALIVGRDASAASIYSFLRSNPRIGLRPLGIIGNSPATDRAVVASHSFGPLSHADALANRATLPWLVVAMPHRDDDELLEIASIFRREAPHRTLVSHLNGSPGVWNRARLCLDWLGSHRRFRQLSWLRLVKRSLDLGLTIVSGLVLLPLLLLIAVVIKLTSAGPVLFRQPRVGLHARRFVVWKFRTMVCDGDRVLNDYLDACPARRAAWERDHKLPHDPRVTRIGRLLRKTSLDELPQLWNVLRGDMSLVGPRPILETEIPDFGSNFEAFCNVLPGITGLWQVSGRNQTTYAEHVELDAYYSHNWSLWLDLYILLLTVRVVLFRHGAY